MKSFPSRPMTLFGILILLALQPGLAAEASAEPLAPRLNGVVHGLNPADVAMVFFARYSDDGNHRDTRRVLVESDGTFHFDELTAGDWIAEARIHNSGRKATGRLSIEPGVRVSTLELRFDPSSDRSLKGVLRINGAPTADRQVSWIEGPALSLPVEATTDAEGRFSLRGIPLGSQVLEVKGPWGTHRQTVDNDGSDRDVVLSLETRRIAGRVLDAAGDPIAGASLTWIYPKADAQSFSDLDHTTVAAPESTGSDGRFHLPAVRSGAVRLVFRHGSHGFLQHDLDLQSDLNALDLQFKPAYPVRFELQDPDGSSPREASLMILGDGTAPIPLGNLETAGSAPQAQAHLPEGRWRVLLWTDTARTRPFSIDVPGGPYTPQLRPKTVLDLSVPELETAEDAKILLLDSRGELHSARDLGLATDAWPLTNGRLTVTVPQDTWTARAVGTDGRPLEQTTRTDPSQWTDVTLR